MKSFPVLLFTSVQFNQIHGYLKNIITIFRRNVLSVKNRVCEAGYLMNGKKFNSDFRITLTLTFHQNDYEILILFKSLSVFDEKSLKRKTKLKNNFISSVH